MLTVGAMNPLIALLQSDNVEVQCNACGCLTTLATNGKVMSENFIDMYVNLYLLKMYIYFYVEINITPNCDKLCPLVLDIIGSCSPMF